MTDNEGVISHRMCSVTPSAVLHHPPLSAAVRTPHACPARWREEQLPPRASDSQLGQLEWNPDSVTVRGQP